MIYHSNVLNVEYSAHKIHTVVLCAVFFILFSTVLQTKKLFAAMDYDSVKTAFCSEKIITRKNLSFFENNCTITENNFFRSHLFLMTQNQFLSVDKKDSVNSYFTIPATAYIGATLLLENWIFKDKDVNFRQMRNEIIPHFSYDYDTYLQFVPFGITLAMKSFAIPSHSSWQQLLSSSVLSYVFGYGTTKIVKENYKELRPDWGGVKSFPSGHTTVAFINASILSHEYKEAYPWLSIAGYTMAGITGLSRIANNRHWLHDVVAGAGIGILATDLSYMITDVFFQNSSNNRFAIATEDFKQESPNYCNIYLAYAIPLNDYPKLSSNNMKYTVHSGSSLGMETSYFFNSCVGLTVRAKIDDYWLNNEEFSWTADSVFNIYGLDFGLASSYPVYNKIFVGCRAAIGLSYVEQQEIQFYNVLPRQRHFMYSFGIFANLWTHRHTFLRFYADYNSTKLDIDNVSQRFSAILLGSSVGLHF